MPSPPSLSPLSVEGLQSDTRSCFWYQTMLMELKETWAKTRFVFLSPPRGRVGCCCFSVSCLCFHCRWTRSPLGTKKDYIQFLAVYKSWDRKITKTKLQSHFCCCTESFLSKVCLYVVHVILQKKTSAIQNFPNILCYQI